MEKNIFNPAFVFCSSRKRFLGVRSWYFNKMPIIWVCVDILQQMFSELNEAENISQNSGYPQFCNSTRNSSIKTHGFYKRVARHMQNFSHWWYSHLSMTFIELISLFQVTKNMAAVLTFSWYFWSVSTVISLLISPSITLFCVFYFQLLVPKNKSVVPVWSPPANMGLLDKIDLSKITSRSIKAKYMLGVNLKSRFFVSWYSCNFGGTKLKYLSRCCLAIWGFSDEVLGIDPIQKKWTFNFPPWMGQPQYLNQEN